ncbi:HipA domain-containing protein [Treponema sp.]|uniref:HipA domain-containing protein n=1 Tax=Treponema sp. TaxID=166 RepID=UPI0025CCFF5E|nr:HipA domain-containing protein [Treponema sp.]MCR5218657.1 HipA domain-containing protein [Treponema sp.]
MEYLLYKKNIPLLKYKEEKGYIEVQKVFNKEHLPVALFINGKASDENLYALNEKMERFLNNRLIPSTRPNFKEALKELGIDSNYELAKKSFFLSLTDQYWICPLELKDKLFWEDINFFANEYNSDIGIRLVNNSESLNKNSNSTSPDNATNGELAKRWHREGGVNYLEKAGTGSEQLEPVNEVLASEICRRLGIPYVPYFFKERAGKYFCDCPDMVDQTCELVPMDAVYEDLHLTEENFYDYQQLINRCSQMNIPNVEEDLLKVLLLDFIIANVDRHSYNISFIRNSNTLQWKGLAPVYDSGKTMFLDEMDFEIAMTSSGQIKAKPFFNTQAEQISKLPFYKIASSVNLDKLEGIDQWYADFLKPLKRIPQEKKSALVEKLSQRIQEAKEILQSLASSQKVKNKKASSVQLVFEALKRNPGQTKEELSNSTGLSRATITRAYALLEKKEKIERIGSNKTGWWKILE